MIQVKGLRFAAAHARAGMHAAIIVGPGAASTIISTAAHAPADRSNEAIAIKWRKINALSASQIMSAVERARWDLCSYRSIDYERLHTSTELGSPFSLEKLR